MGIFKTTPITVTINLDASDFVLQTKTATPTETAQEITADEGYEGLESVKVLRIPSNYIIPAGSIIITENGTYNVKNYEEADVDVITSGVSMKRYLEEGYTNITEPRITRLKARAFRYDKVLESISLPVCEEIGAEAFHYCSNLKTASLPACTAIKAEAFASSGIQSIVLPQIEEIGEDAFYASDLYLLDLSGVSSVPTLGAYALERTPIWDGNGSILVPAALLENFKTATNWSEYANEMEGV